MKIIKIDRCRNCFYIRNLADEEKTYCCYRDIMEMDNHKFHKIKNIDKIPKWCLLDEK